MEGPLQDIGTLTVCELIDALKKMPGELPVCFDAGSWRGWVKKIKISDYDGSVELIHEES